MSRVNFVNEPISVGNSFKLQCRTLVDYYNKIQLKPKGKNVRFGRLPISAGSFSRCPYSNVVQENGANFRNRYVDNHIILSAVNWPISVGNSWNFE